MINIPPPPPPPPPKPPRLPPDLDYAKLYGIEGNDVPPITTPSGELDENEVTAILDKHLKPKNRNDYKLLKFISAFLRCRHTAQAAREAGYDPRDGLSLRNRKDVSACIDALTNTSIHKYGFDATEVVERVRELADVDPIEFFNPDGTYKELAQMRPEARRAIKKLVYEEIWGKDPNGMKVQIGRIIKIEIHGKERALELIGREKELFVEKTKVEHDVTKNMKQILLGASDRAKSRVRDVIEIQGRTVNDGERGED